MCFTRVLFTRFLEYQIFSRLYGMYLGHYSIRDVEHIRRAFCVARLWRVEDEQESVIDRNEHLYAMYNNADLMHVHVYEFRIILLRCSRIDCVDTIICSLSFYRH